MIGGIIGTAEGSDYVGNPVMSDRSLIVFSSSRTYVPIIMCLLPLLPAAEVANTQKYTSTYSEFGIPFFLNPIPFGKIRGDSVGLCYNI